MVLAYSTRGLMDDAWGSHPIQLEMSQVLLPEDCRAVGAIAPHHLSWRGVQRGSSVVGHFVVCGIEPGGTHPSSP